MSQPRRSRKSGRLTPRAGMVRLTNDERCLTNCLAQLPRRDPMMRRLHGLVFLIALSVLVSTSTARAAQQNSTWTDANGTHKWADKNDWNPVLSIPPINELIPGLEFNVTIPTAN